MRVYSNKIGWETIAKGLRETNLENEGVVLRALVNVERGEKKRQWDHAFDFTLRATAGEDRFGRKRNHPSMLSRSVPIEEGYPKSPTYDEWGVLINWLYKQEPEAHIGPYKNQEHFNSSYNVALLMD